MSLPLILVVDDEPAIRKAFGRLGRGRFATVGAGDVTEALDVLETARPVAAVVDYNLPGRKGDDLLREIRKRYPHIHRILLSGAAPKHVDDLLREGVAERFYAKPWPSGELIAYLLSLRRRDSDEP